MALAPTKPSSPPSPYPCSSYPPVALEIGKLIQVLGTPFTGYGLEFRRNYDLSNITERYGMHLLEEMDDKYVNIEKQGDGEMKEG
jgi:hypothetical protein